MTESFRWGILGTGGIAKQFARGLAALPDASLAAVGSRSQEGAAAFAKEFGAARAHASYADLVADPTVDAIYVATPHPFHRAHTELALRAGKAVLCEKPFAVNRAEGEAMVATARSQGRFLMEAMWTRFLPVTVRVRTWIAAGRIGEVRQIQGDFGFRCGWNPASRLLAKDLAGGALLDVGIYCLAYARMCAGSAPDQVLATAHLGETGVDEQVAILARHPGGVLVNLTAAVRTSTPHRMVISGTAGRIEVPAFWHASEATCFSDGVEPERFAPPAEGNGYQHQAAEVARCVRAGLRESPVMPLDETLALLATMDEIRRQIGLVYPSDLKTAKA